MSKFKAGDLVQLNAYGKNRIWLERARNAIGFVVKVHMPEENSRYKAGSLTIHWNGLTPAPWWHSWNRLEKRVIPQNCVKKIRQRKQK